MSLVSLLYADSKITFDTPPTSGYLNPDRRLFMDDIAEQLVWWDDINGVELFRIGNGGSETGSGYYFLDKINPVEEGQTNFYLSAMPNPKIKPLVTINGQEQRVGEDYSIVGNTLTWLSKLFTINITDQINVYF